MRKKLALCLALCMLLAGCGFQTECQKHSITLYGTFDTVVTLTGYASEKTFQQEAGKVREMLEYYNMVFDAYQEYDGMNNLCTLNRLGGQATVTVPEPLADVILQCQRLAQDVDGGTNIALGSVLFLWHDFREAYAKNPENASLPDERTLQLAAEHTCLTDVTVDEAASTVRYEDAALKLDLGAVAKGYAAQKIAEMLLKSDMPSFLLSLGGNVVAGEAPLDGRAFWSVGVQDPSDQYGATLDVVFVTERSVVTSGDYQRYCLIDGTRYHHIIDPETLYPAQYVRAVTVVCQDAFLADYLSTALFLMPPEQGMTLVETLENVEALWVTQDNTVQMTPGMKEIAQSLGANAHRLAGE